MKSQAAVDDPPCDSLPGVPSGDSAQRPFIGATAPIAVAMSGGLDSSLAASLLASGAVPVVGLSMLLWDHSEERRNGRCCSALDLGDARRVAQQVGIPHYTLRLDREFRRQVVDPFVDDYLAGRTPSPCVRCNTWIKFDLLLERARALGATKVATGHYARIVAGEDGYQLHQALDTGKDQSYYLFELDQKQLASACFPLGEMTKQEVRRRARDLDLVVADKAESFEVCFVSGSVEEFVTKESRARGLPISTNGASVVDRGGQSLGVGSPYYRYTVGQRRGLGISANQPLYVLEVDAESNRVVVGSRDELLADGLLGERLHWIGPAPASGRIEATVKIRSRHPGVEAEIEALEKGRARVLFHEPQSGVAPGQAAVFYRGSQVLGGCWITAALGLDDRPEMHSAEIPSAEIPSVETPRAETAAIEEDWT